MAMLIREEYRLPTLRLRLGSAASTAEKGISTESTGRSDETTPAHPVLLSQIMHGDTAASPWVRTEIAALGLNADSWVSWAFGPDLAATSIGGQVAALGEVAQPGRPLWYHIARDSAPLSLLPWERMFRRITPAPFLRIPNFLEIPYRQAMNPCVAICASAPVGDGPYALPLFVEAVVKVIAAAGAEANARPTVHVFTDQAESPAVDLHIPPSAFPQLILQTHKKPRRAGQNAGQQGTDRSDWLSWIADTLQGMSADIVHFISPGFLEGERGAIVLASSPALNEQRGTILGAGELVSFFDRVGCTAMAFSSPAMPQWVRGQRALAFELSWLRAGPIILTETDTSELQGLAAAYEMLFGPGGSGFVGDLASAPPLHLCCHPSLVDPEQPAFNPSAEEMDPAAAFVRNHKALLTATRSLSTTEQIEQRGTVAAIDFLSSLIESRGARK